MTRQLVAACPATREAVELYGCHLCGRPAGEHFPEAADVARDDKGDFGAWMMSLPRTPPGTPKPNRKGRR